LTPPPPPQTPSSPFDPPLPQPTVSLLEPLRDALKQAAGADLVLHTRAKGDDGAALVDALLSAARASSSPPPAVLACTLKDAHEGALVALWQDKLRRAQEEADPAPLQVVSAADGVASLLALKDDEEQVAVRKAGMLAARVLQEYLVPKMEGAIEAGKRVKHAKLSGEVFFVWSKAPLGSLCFCPRASLRRARAGRAAAPGKISPPPRQRPPPPPLPPSHTHTHTELADSAITDPSKAGARLKPENVDIAYPSMVQSGGAFDLRLGAAPDDATLCSGAGAVVCSIGARYASYCAVVSRTYLINPPEQMEREYAAVLAAQQAASAALVEGAPLSAAHAAAVAALEGAGEAGARLLAVGGVGKSVGHGIGLELRETGAALSAKNTSAEVKAGMCFNVSVGIAGLEMEVGGGGGAVKKEEGGGEGNEAAAAAAAAADTPKKQTLVYALQVSDTVVVQPGGSAPEVATAHAKKDVSTVCYQLDDAAAKKGKEGNGNGGGAADDDDTKGGADSGGDEEAARRKQLRSDAPEFRSEAAERKARQDELLARKNAETLARLTAQRDGGSAGAAAGPSSGGAAGARQASQVVAYRSAADVPHPPGGGLQVAVDARAEAVLLPIYGVLVPFHVATVRGVSHVAEGTAHATIRISFNVGSAGGGSIGGAAAANAPNTYEPARRFPDAALVKELVFRTPDVRHAAKVVQELKTLRSSVLARDKERAERATLVAQEKLIRGKQVFRLADLWVRPSLGGKGRKVPGTLEAHQNGFRYFTPKGETVDVMYRNIRHAFFQVGLVGGGGGCGATFLGPRPPPRGERSRGRPRDTRTRTRSSPSLSLSLSLSIFLSLRANPN
jgi:nucleosome binding factor SPN SPT16 subunit